jgi:SAM-dependent methyltransferase
MSFSQDGADDEMEFWRDVVSRFKRGEMPWLEEQLREVSVSDVIRQNVKSGDGEIQVLDVGSGPFGTMVGGYLDGRQVRITGIDPLADEYRTLQMELGVTSPMSLLNGTAEDMDSITERDFFDFVNSDNAIDHCFDPGRSIRNMVRAAKPGGIVRIKVFVNEGEFTGYSGFHQWNFATLSDRVAVWNRESVTFIDDFADGHPYRVWHGKELTGPERVERDILVIKIVKVSADTHKSHEIKDKCRIALIPEIGTLIIDRLEQFESSKNIFVHVHTGSDVRYISTSSKGSGDRLQITLPDVPIKAVLVGQFRMRRHGNETIFENLWEKWI